MLESKQHSAFWYFLDFYLFNPMPALLRKSVGELIFLILPEDTTEKTGPKDKVIGYEKCNARSISKVVFWIIISITISIAIGQLR